MWQNQQVGYNPPAQNGLDGAQDGCDGTQGSPLRPHPVWCAALATSYVVVTVLVLVPRTPLLGLDLHLRDLHLRTHHPGWQPWLDGYVLLGQRGPSTLAFLPYFGWLSWRQRTSRPLVLLATALLSLNVSVAAVKYGLGRVGPRQTANVHLYLPLTGTIYPSGHVSNAVVLYGLIASTTPQWRRALTAAATGLALTVGACTIYLRTHWFSDVLGAWLAGGLVLLTLPYLYPSAQRSVDAALAAVQRLHRSGRRLAAAHQDRSTLPGMAVRNVQRLLYVFLTRAELDEAITRGLLPPTPLPGRQPRAARGGLVWLSDLIQPSHRPGGEVLLLRPGKHAAASDVVRLTVTVADAQHWRQWARRHRLRRRHRHVTDHRDAPAECWWVVPRPITAAEWLHAEAVADGHRLPIAARTATG